MSSNYPPGTWEGDPRAPWNQEDPICCSECVYWFSDDGEQGICCRLLEEADDDGRFQRRIAVGGGQTRKYTDCSLVIEWACGHITPSDEFCEYAKEN